MIRLVLTLVIVGLTIASCAHKKQFMRDCNELGHSNGKVYFFCEKP